MSEISRLYATDDTFREVANLLFGGGADELVAKLSPEEKKRQKRQAQVGLATNIIGITAGTAATAESAKKLRATRRGEKAIPFKNLKFAGKLKRLSVPATLGAGMGLGLQSANLGGDMIANRVLSREAKKKVSKSEPTSSDVHIPSMGKLKRVAAQKAVQKGKEKAPEIKRGSLKVLNQMPQLQREKVTKAEVTWEGEFSKVDTDKRQVFGWASIVELNGEPVVDLQGDYIDIDEIEKSAYDYVIKSRKGGDMHRRNPDDTPVHSSDMIESFLVTPEKKEKLGLPDSVPTGWWVGYQINDDDAWNLVKSGKRTGFSIHGRGQRDPGEV